MKKSIIIWATAIILVIIAIYTTNSYNAKANIAKDTPQAGQTVPAPSPATAEDNSPGNQQSNETFDLMKDYDFTLEDLEGNQVTLSELKGKKVFLNFWATWCPPCKAEMPDMEKLYQETKESDLVILAVNVGEDKKTVQDFIANNNYNFPVLLDTKGDVSRLYQVSGIPTSYFIGTNGLLDSGHTGAMPYESMKESVNNLK